MQDQENQPSQNAEVEQAEAQTTPAEAPAMSDLEAQLSATEAKLAKATMWTYHGREFPAPTFELGMAPAGCMYSTVLDLAKFASCLFAGGKVGEARLLKPETIAEMLRPQFAKPEDKTGFGIGFRLSELDGLKRVGHGGAIYGFATTFH